MIKKFFSKPSVLDTAKAELYEAQQKLMEAQTGLEYAAAMVEYNTNRVARLKTLIEQATTYDIKPSKATK